MFDFMRALKAVLHTHPDDDLTPLMTKWGETLDPDAVLQEYPRPQMQRDSYINLNGWWEYAITETPLDGKESAPQQFDGKILVPFSPEAALSGVNKQLQPYETLWYKRTVPMKKKAGMRYLLHFEAVDFECTCFVNGTEMGGHLGGYTPFSFDITDALDEGKSDAELCLRVHDPSEYGGQPRGKQRIDRGSIWCTAQSGIWQTVWLEEVPDTYLEKLRIDADPDTETLTLEVCLGGTVDGQNPQELRVTVADANGKSVAKATLDVSEQQEDRAERGHMLQISVPVEGAHAWYPDDPYLYNLEIAYGKDTVKSYCAFRIFTTEVPAHSPNGKKVFCCNHEPLFLKGLLDQGYWPDGLLTAPSDDALLFDIELAREFGFNMMRKHIKVEQARWYYHCDRLGMIVWQDMINGGESYKPFYTNELPTVFPWGAKHLNDTRDLQRFGSADPIAQQTWLNDSVAIMEHLRNFPCIGTWTVFNEGWGQFDANAMTEKLRAVDDSRPFDQTSGWFDQGGGDYASDHNYFRDMTVPKGRGKHDLRAPVISEFGGYAHHVPGHSSLDRAYGYALFETEHALHEAVTSLFDEVNALETQGLSGYVYTQLSDVEEEVNGIVTFDRSVVKLTPDCMGIRDTSHAVGDGADGNNAKGTTNEPAAR